MNSHHKTVLAAALLSMTVAACSNRAGNTTNEAPVAAALQTQPATAEQERGAVQRDYPSVAEEADLKLNYPLFLAYGGDSARITPLPPKAAGRPVSVKLAPNAAGYSLAAQGNECAFPIDYMLKSLSGSQIRSGEYKGGPIDLAGWDSQTGYAVLTLRMAADAGNNFGCNIVVSKK